MSDPTARHPVATAAPRAGWWRLAVVVSVALFAGAVAPANALTDAELERLRREEQQRHDERWAFIVDSEFGGRPVRPADGLLELDLLCRCRSAVG